MFLLLALLVGGGVAVRRLLPTGFRQRLSQMPGRMIGGMLEHMPEE
ncbi:hypothetical protein LCGC14_2524400 [marine sediment metagenome]|uniref:Uncharacterized protein n=1 Tax=marine sediment metagenome TaxID=412755 RepID=A0A0F9AVT7_9ZZZZ